MFSLAANWEVHTTLPHTYIWENSEIKRQKCDTITLFLPDLTLRFVAFVVLAHGLTS